MIECPYCESDVEIPESESNYQEVGKHKIRCNNCKKLFLFTTQVTIEFIDAEEANYLNT